MADFNFYINSYGNYNDCKEGAWMDIDEILDAGEEELQKRFGEELFIQDYENDFNVEFDESFSIKMLEKIKEKIEEDEDIFKAICECDGLECAIDTNFEYVIFYKNQTLLDVAYDYINDCCNIPDFVKNYIDYKSFADDLSYDGYREATSGVYTIE